MCFVGIVCLCMCGENEDMEGVMVLVARKKRRRGIKISKEAKQGNNN